MKALQENLSEKFGIVFTDVGLLETAFTHTSYANEHRALKVSHNERLEFLGDAVLQLIISSYIYEAYPNLPEGAMSKMRASFVREESLAGFSRMCEFDKAIRLGKGEEKTGGRNRDTILGDVFEAFLGALLLDKGVGAVEQFLQTVMIPALEKGHFERVTDYKTALQEILQVSGEVVISYPVISETGPAHDKVFEVEVLADGRVIGRGKGRSKKAAEQDAAKQAVEALK